MTSGAAAGVNFCSTLQPGGPPISSRSFLLADAADDHKFKCESASFGSDLSVGGIVICCWPRFFFFAPGPSSSSSPYT